MKLAVLEGGWLFILFAGVTGVCAGTVSKLSSIYEQKVSE